MTCRCKFDSDTAVVIDHAERADAGGGEIEQHRRAQAAGADHQHARGLELGLPRAADLAQHDVARIAFQFFCVEHRINPSAWPRKWDRFSEKAMRKQKGLALSASLLMPCTAASMG